MHVLEKINSLELHLFKIMLHMRRILSTMIQDLGSMSRFVFGHHRIHILFMCQDSHVINTLAIFKKMIACLSISKLYFESSKFLI